MSYKKIRKNAYPDYTFFFKNLSNNKYGIYMWLNAQYFLFAIFIQVYRLKHVELPENTFPTNSVN